MAIQVLVQCTLEVPILIEDEEIVENIQFHIEENSCPGTGLVGTAIDRVMAEAESKHTCWACSLNGVNKILQVKSK